MDRRKFRIGIPNRGRLSGLCRELLIDRLKMLPEEARDSRAYAFETVDGQAEVVMARSSNLPRLIEEGYVDVCITGLDYVLESRQQLVELMDLKFCPGTICLLVPKEKETLYLSAADLHGKKLATQLPNITADWLKREGLDDVEVVATDGANEVYPHMGVVDVTVDMVATGETMRANNLEICCEIVYSSGRLYAHTRSLKEYEPEVRAFQEKVAALDFDE